MDEIYESQYTGEQIDSGVGNGLKLEGKTIVTALGNDDTTIPTSKAVKDSQSNFVTTTDLSTALANKVDKVTGYGLSQNDFTNNLKTAYDSAVTATDQLLPSQTTYYVDATNGSDDNDGTQNAPFKTIMKAVRLCQYAQGEISVYVASGTFNETVRVKWIDYIRFYIMGTVTINDLYAEQNATVRISGVSNTTPKLIAKQVNCYYSSSIFCEIPMESSGLLVSYNSHFSTNGGVSVNTASGNPVIVDSNSNAVFINNGISISGNTSSIALLVRRGSYFSSDGSITIDKATTAVQCSASCIRINGLSATNYTTKLFKEKGGQILTGAGVDLT